MRVDGVQVLRALAASMVVVGHSQTSVVVLSRLAHVPFRRSYLLPWGASVDLFFVISGFIMVYASQRFFGVGGGSGEFLRRRLVRVVPLYWLCTLAYLGVVMAAHLKGAPLSFGPLTVAASLFFLPYPSYGPTGGLFPVLDLGWTLNYEMFFYVLFAGAVLLPRRRAVAAVSAVLLGLAIVGLLNPAAGPLRFWTRPIVLDFGLGALVAQLRCEGVRWPLAARLALLSVGAAAFALDPLRLYVVGEGVTVANGWPRVLESGLPAALMLAAAVFGPDLAGRRAQPATALGNASYSLYLAHPFALMAVEKLAVKTGLVARIGPWPVVVLEVAAAVATAAVVFRWVEEPLTRQAQRLTVGADRTPLTARPPPAAAPEPALPFAAAPETAP